MTTFYVDGVGSPASATGDVAGSHITLGGKAADPARNADRADARPQSPDGLDHIEVAARHARGSCVRPCPWCAIVAARPANDPLAPLCLE